MKNTGTHWLLKTTAVARLAAAAALLPIAAAASAPPPVADPDAPNAPIADRETFNARPKETRQAPELAQIGVPRTNYPIPNGALFASPSGNVGAPGTNRNAPTTLAHAVATAPVGGTVVLSGGDYRGVANLKIPHQMTLQAAPGETAWIKGSVVVAGFAPNNGRWSVAWDKKLTHPNELDLDKNNPIAGDTDMVFVAGRSLKQVSTLQEVTAGTFFVDTTAKKLVLGADPTGKMVEVTTDELGLEIKGQAALGTIVRGLGFAHFSGRAVEAHNKKLLFENNTFAWNAARGLALNGADHVVRGNVFACNGLSGGQGVYNDRLVFENNRVMFNNIEGFRRTWAAAGVKFVINRDVIFRNNLFENNQAAALWFDISTVRANVLGNVFRSNLGSGIFYELSHSGIVAFNVLQDNNTGLMLSDASAIRAWNNTFLGNAKAIVVKDTPRFNDISKAEGFYSSKQKAEDIAAGSTWITANNEFHNNLFAGARDNKTVLFDAGPAMKGKSSGDMISGFDHNAYARTAPNTPRHLVRWHSGGKPTDFDSLDEFRAANANYEANAMLLEPAPLFADASARDYRLLPNSSLLKAGTPLPPEVRAAAMAAGIKLPAQGIPIGAFGADKPLMTRPRAKPKAS